MAAPCGTSQLWVNSKNRFIGTNKSRFYDCAVYVEFLTTTGSLVVKLIEPNIELPAEIIAIRRDIHAHPELGFEEVRTADVIANKLASWGIEVHRGLAVTGVIGTISGKTNKSGRAIGLRADIDALPMQELNTFEHASQHPGKMHACGHDGHTAMLLEASRQLAESRDFDGIVYVIFQPGEEGAGGAKRMVAEGLFTLFPMDAIFGMHNWPNMEVGKFGVIPGPIMASSNPFRIVIEGKGAHAAMPNLGIDPIMAAVQLAQGFQTILTRNRDPFDPAVLSLTQIHAGSADNVIPDKAELRGTVRAFSEASLDLIERRMGELTQLTCEAFNCQSQFEFTRRCPATVNSVDETAFSIEVLNELVGAENVDTAIRPTMGAEDFSHMLKVKPGCYIHIGNGQGDHRTPGHGLGPCMLHNASYDFNDALIPLGASYWVALAHRWLAKKAGS
jgi:hippurate hydrolase